VTLENKLVSNTGSIISSIFTTPRHMI